MYIVGATTVTVTVIKQFQSLGVQSLPYKKQ